MSIPSCNFCKPAQSDILFFKLAKKTEQKLKKKLYSALRSKAEINDLSEKLLTKYLEQKKELQQSFFSLHSKKENSDLSRKGKVRLCEEADGIYYFKLAL